MANMNVRPYYEDFDDSKNFYRILFRPSFSLQARELTQSQTLIYDQLDKVNTLSDGDKISSGEITYDNGTVYLNSGTYYVNGVAVTVDASTITNVTNGKVGFKVLEQFISPEEDQTLYDNAYGTPNFLAPGAHRYKIELELFSRDLDYQSTDDFIEIFRVVNSKVQKLSADVKTEAFLVEDFDIDLKDADSEYEISLSNGKISIDNHIVDVSNAPITISKPRVPVGVSNVTANANDGNYLVVTAHSTGWDPLIQQLILMNWETTEEGSSGIVSLNLSETDELSSSIGTAVIKNVAYHDDTSIRLYLSEIDLPIDKSLSDIGYLHLADEANPAAVVLEAYTSGNSMSIFPFSETNMTKSETTSKTIFYRQRVKEQGSHHEKNSFTITGVSVDSNFNLTDIDLEQLVIFGPYSAGGGTLVPYTKDNLRIVKSENGAGQSVFTIFKEDNTDFSAGVYVFFYDKKIEAVDSQITKYSKEGKVETLAADSNLYLGTSKSYQLENGLIIPSSVVITQDEIDITDRFIIDDGQRDDIITKGSILLKEGQPDVVSTLTVTYSYWKLNQGKNYATVDSYLATQNTNTDVLALYADIPVYNGIKLSDSLDLRRHVDSNILTWSSSGQVEIDNANVYGSRIDKITVDSNGNVGSIEGISYNDQSLSPDDNENLTVFEATLNGYGYNSSDITLSKSTSQELSKSDIDNIDERLSALELESKFSPLETEALTQKVPLEHGGVNAVLVDPFLGHDKGDVTNVDYMAAIDYETNSLRPSYNSYYVGMSAYNLAELNWYGKNLTLDPASEISDISNLKGTDTIVINEFSDQYNGTLILTPNHSFSKSTEREQILFDDDGYFSNISDLSDENKTTNTIWKDWELFWYGSGIKSSPIIELINKDDTKIGINYKSQFAGNTIDATVTGLAPTTDHDVFLDGAPLKDSGESEVTITTDSLGSYTFTGSGNIVIPSEGLSGKVLVEVKSDDGLSKASNYYHNEGVGNFLNYGELGNSVSQEFEVFEDTFFSKVDLYFSSKDDTLPVQVELREMINGVPSKNIRASKSIESSKVKIIGATSVEFSKIPFVNGEDNEEDNEIVCLKKGKYCITIIGNSNYSLYGDRDGVSDLDVGRFYRGSSKISNFKLKFDLYRVVFSSADKTFNVKTDRISAPINKIYSNPEVDNQIIVYQDNHGYNSGSVTISPGTGFPIEELTLAAPVTSGGQSIFGTLPKGTLVFSGDYTTDYNNVTAWGYVMSDMTSIGTQSPAPGATIKIAVITGTFIGQSSSTITDGELVAEKVIPSEDPTDQFVGANFFSVVTDNGVTTGTTASETHIAGIDTSLFGIGTVSSSTRSSYTWEKTGLFPKTLGYTIPPDNTVVNDFKSKIDSIYIRSDQNKPGDTKLDWMYEDKYIQPNRTNTFTGAPEMEYTFKVNLEADSGNDRFSPVVYMDTLSSVLISNNIDEGLVYSTDAVNLSKISEATGNAAVGSAEVSATWMGNKRIEVEQIEPVNYDANDADWVAVEKYKNLHQKWLSVKGGDILYLESPATNASGEKASGFVQVVDHVYYSNPIGEDDVISETYVAPTPNTVSPLVTDVIVPKFHITITNLEGESFPNGSFGTEQTDVTTIYKYTGQYMETSLVGSSSMSKYISKRISVPVQSSGVCVEFMGDVSAGNEIEVYYNIDDVEYKKLPNYSFGDVETYGIYPTGGTSGYEKIIYSGGTGKLFNFLQVKIVFKGSNSTNVPKLKDLKIFAFATS